MSVKYKRLVNKSRLNIKVGKQKSAKYKRSVNKSRLNIKGR